MAVDNGLIDGNVEVADLQRLVPVTLQRANTRKLSGDIGTIAKVYVGDTVADDDGGAAWTVAARVDINSMSKYKPVRFNKIKPLTNAEFRSIRYGLRPKGTGGGYATFSSSLINPDVAWIYDKPRGLSYNEPYRINDFYHYFHRATPPFAFEVSGELGNSIGITYYIDNLAASIYNSGADAAGSWHPEYNITLADLFNGYQTPSNSSYLCVCVHDVTENVYKGTVVFKKQVGDLHNTAVSLIMFAEQTTLSGVTYPAVQFLQDQTKSGHTFRFIVGLRNAYSGGTAPYEVFNGGSGIDVYPMAFKEGIDRKDIKLYSYHTIHDLQCWFADPSGNLSASYLGRETYNGRSMDKYIITGNLYGRFVTPSDFWTVTGATIKITMRTQGYVSVNELTASASLPDAGKPYEELLVQFGANATAVYLYIEPAADSRTLKFLGVAEYAYEQVPFQAPFTVNIPKGY